MIMSSFSAKKQQLRDLWAGAKDNEIDEAIATMEGICGNSPETKLKIIECLAKHDLNVEHSLSDYFS